MVWRQCATKVSPVSSPVLGVSWPNAPLLNVQPDELVGAEPCNVRLSPSSHQCVAAIPDPGRRSAAATRGRLPSSACGLWDLPRQAGSLPGILAGSSRNQQGVGPQSPDRRNPN